MKTNLIFAILMGLALHPAVAGDFDPKRCMDRCAPTLEEESEESARHAEKLKTIRAQRDGVSNEAVLKRLEQEENNEIDRHQDAIIKACRYICYK